MTQVAIGNQTVETQAEVAENWGTSALIEDAIRHGEGLLAKDGPLVVETGKHTGRSAKDKFIVQDAETADTIWWGKTNVPMTPDHFAALKADFLAHMAARPRLFRQQLFGGSQPEHRVAVQVVTEFAWHSQFIRTLARPPDRRRAGGVRGRIYDHRPAQLPRRSGEAWHAHRNRRRGQLYRKARADRRHRLCRRNEEVGVRHPQLSAPGEGRDADALLGQHGSERRHRGVLRPVAAPARRRCRPTPSRTLIGDDEHGWSDTAVFNFEGGCYAKMIRLSPEAEPEIFATTKRFGTVLENVVIDPVTRELDFDDDSLAENSRGSYPIDFIPNTSEQNMGPVPQNIIMLTADAYGVLPPIAKLTPDQAMYHFLSGYTARVAGTEIGVTEPEATFSTCFGAPFMPRHPSVYGNLLKERIAKGGVQCWLVNTGWTGGMATMDGIKRMPIKATRALLNAAIDGSLNDAEFRKDPNFGFMVPVAVPGVDSALLDPREAWADKAAYDRTAQMLVGQFIDNFAQFADHVDEGVRQAAPQAAVAA